MNEMFANFNNNSQVIILVIITTIAGVFLFVSWRTARNNYSNKAILFELKDVAEKLSIAKFDNLQETNLENHRKINIFSGDGTPLLSEIEIRFGALRRLHAITVVFNTGLIEKIQYEDYEAHNFDLEYIIPDEYKLRLVSAESGSLWITIKTTLREGIADLDKIAPYLTEDGRNNLRLRDKIRTEMEQAKLELAQVKVESERLDLLKKEMELRSVAIKIESEAADLSQKKKDYYFKTLKNISSVKQLRIKKSMEAKFKADAKVFNITDQSDKLS